MNRKLTYERPEFGKCSMGPLDEVIHQISIGCDMQFQRKVRRKIFISHEDSKIVKKSLNRKLTCEWSEFGKRGMGPLDEVIHQRYAVSEKNVTKLLVSDGRTEGWTDGQR